MSSSGTNPNAKPFVPSFLAQGGAMPATSSPAPPVSFPRPHQYPPFQPSQQQQQQQHGGYRPSMMAPPFVPGGALAGPYAPPPAPYGGGGTYQYQGQQQQQHVPYTPYTMGGLASAMPPPSAFIHNNMMKAAARDHAKSLAAPSATTADNKSRNNDKADAAAPWTVVMFLGPRGSGKSTQGKSLAKKLNLLFVSAGDLMREEKQPFLALREIVEKEFGGGRTPATATYRGLALDRFIVAGDCDVYYLQWALSAAPGMPVPYVFLLMIDFDVAQKRADARETTTDAQRPKSLQRRMLEHRAQFDACENIYLPMKCLRRIDCDDMTADEIHSIIVAQMKVLQSMPKCGTVDASKLPPAPLSPALPSTTIVADVEKFVLLKTDTHKAIDSTLIHHAPASHMSGYVDGRLVDDKKLRAYFSTCWVTLKADGQRLILVKHRTLGLFGFPFAFTACYDMNDALKDVEWPAAPASWQATSEVEFILDCEVVASPASSSTAAATCNIFIFDAIFYFGTKGKTTPFSSRLELLRQGFEALPANGVVHLKQYVGAKDLPTLLPDYDNPPFPIDGVIFQPDSFYVYGKDKHLYKWKPIEKSTVDFRLYAGQEPTTPNGDWTFEAKVQSTSKGAGGGGVEEVSMPNVQIRIPDATVISEGLSDGAIVECIRLESEQPTAPKTTASSAPPVEVWSFYRTRREKVYPNQDEIALTIAKMKPLSYQQLLSFAKSIKK